MRAVLDWLIRRFIQCGTLRVRWPDNTLTTYQGTPGPDIAFAIRDWTTVRAIVLNPAMAIGEAYMHGGIVAEHGDIYGLLDLLLSNHANDGSFQPVLALQNWHNRVLRRIAQWNPAFRSARNVAHHYDIDGRIYRLFLDEDMQYSCAYFPTGTETLEQAQAAKQHHIAAKLNLNRPGLRVLDIGSGWGGMALTLARDYGCHVTGITLSHEQLDIARARAEAAGLSDRVRFELRDYRNLTETYDRIVSVGMFEHVGVGYFDEFFSIIRRSLAPDGVALLHSIGRLRGPAATNPWLAKYIFPGGYAPALSEVLPAVEQSGLLATDIEILRLHYANTLREWRARFAARRDDVVGLTDETFFRMFEFYFVASELAFRRTGQMVFQLQLTRDQQAVPLTRAYLANRPSGVANS
jgi:cyclopropane-fatty-acyl-phospholipid synthase